MKLTRASTTSKQFTSNSAHSNFSSEKPLKLPTSYSYICKHCHRPAHLYNLKTGHPVTAPDRLCDDCRLEGTYARDLKTVAINDGFECNDYECLGCNRIYTLLLGQDPFNRLKDIGLCPVCYWQQLGEPDPNAN